LAHVFNSKVHKVLRKVREGLFAKKSTKRFQCILALEFQKQKKPIPFEAGFSNLFCDIFVGV
jgi:hypothetical protein